MKISEDIIRTDKLDFNWFVANPFMFCVHHLDYYPQGTETMTPDASLEGRNIGQDFTAKDGWRMYHGQGVPGFPAHPHRGFETVTIVLKGIVDHFDSNGQKGRYGMGDVQWMTAGSGLQHSEMFPLVNRKEPNTLELFQIWLNLPRAGKFANPHYKMLWNEKIPVLRISDENGKQTEVKLIAGQLNKLNSLSPTPDSWAADPGNEVAIWIISMEADALWKLPAASKEANRILYFYEGQKASLNYHEVKVKKSFQLVPEHEIEIRNGQTPGYFLVLQGKPIHEPVVQYGPFVMNTEAEIRAAFSDFRATGFGGWPWPHPDPVNPRQEGRFSQTNDQQVERPPGLGD